MGGHPCGAPTTYYHGDYTDTPPQSTTQTGTMTACIVTAGHLLGRWQGGGDQGDLDVTLNSGQNGFDGTFSSDSFGAMFTYTGTFTSHFPGDGCCVTTGGGGSLAPPNTFCPPGTASDTGPVAHAATLDCVGREYIEFDTKGQARSQLRVELKLTVAFCGLATLVIKTGHGNEDQDVLDFVDMCRLLASQMGATLATVRDPPAAHFTRIELLRAFGRASARTIRCPKGLSARVCRALVKARTEYLHAVRSVTSAADALGRSANLFAGARQANAPASAFLQEAAGKIYAGGMATRLHTEQVAGRALAKLLTADHLDINIAGRQVRGLGSKIAGKVITGQLLHQLVVDGLAPDPAGARSVAATLSGVSGSIDIGSAFGAPLPTTDFTRHYMSLTMSELTSLVTGLNAQGDLSNAASQTLTQDLVTAQAACGNPTQRVAAIHKFATDASTLASGSTARFLELGAIPLAANRLPSASCQ
jgi:hypothetical protein